MICVRTIHECFQKGLSFNQETTLCGKSIINNILEAKDREYRVELYYVGLDSPELAKERVRERVKNGGHGIPEKDIDRRYYESLENLRSILSLCDKVVIFDNSDEFNKVAEYVKGECKWRSEKAAKWYFETMK
jgi:predicted ABC-type ATPase